MISSTCIRRGKSFASRTPLAAATLIARATRSVTTKDSSVTPFNSSFDSSMLRPRHKRIPTSLVLPPYTVTYKSPYPTVMFSSVAAP